jgi:two-component system LytT family response regulator
MLTKENEKFIVDYTLDEIEQALDPKNFFRANRQMVLSTSAVVAIHAWFNGKLKVDVVPPAAEHVIISREKSSEFKAWLGE